MNIVLKNKNIDLHANHEIERLLAVKQEKRGDLEQMWYLMDIVWDEYGCNNKKPNWDKINQFYSHPIWLLNGFFIEQHELSMQHRNAIGNWVVKKNFKKIADYGGGHGTLAKLIAEKNPNILIDIYEPHPSNYMIEMLQSHSNINIVTELSKYDCLISTDVLEHVPDPLLTFSEMILSVNEKGYLIIANNFNPVIKCHLPQTFHLKYTFKFFAKIMGLKALGQLNGSHAFIYQKNKSKKINWFKIRFFEFVSQNSRQFIPKAMFILRAIKRKFFDENSHCKSIGY